MPAPTMQTLAADISDLFFSGRIPDAVYRDIRHAVGGDSPPEALVSIFALSVKNHEQSETFDKVITDIAAKAAPLITKSLTNG